MCVTLASDGAVGEAARTVAEAAAGRAEERAALMQHACEHTQVWEGGTQFGRDSGGVSAPTFS